MSDMTPTAVANEALLAAGSKLLLGNIEEGSKTANICLIKYRQCLRTLLQTANWDFARKQAPLVLLGDASRQTPDVGTLVPIPWTYVYAYPIDCMRVRYVPANPRGLNGYIPQNNVQLPNVPLTTGGPAYTPGMRIVPARFLKTTDANYPGDPTSAWQDVQGVSPAGRTVIVTNVKDAIAIYTSLVIYQTLWDPQFRQAMVAYLSSEIALAVNTDMKVGMALRTQNIAIAKQRIMEARVSDGNEVGFANVDHTPDWMRTRSYGLGGNAGFWGGAGGEGYFFGPYGGCGFADGSGLSSSASF